MSLVNLGFHAPVPIFSMIYDGKADIIVDAAGSSRQGIHKERAAEGPKQFLGAAFQYLGG